MQVVNEDEEDHAAEEEDAAAAEEEEEDQESGGGGGEYRLLNEAQLNNALVAKRSWESHVDCVMNIEREDNGQLMVHLKWKDGNESLHTNDQVNKKCPQAVKKIILFEVR